MKGNQEQNINHINFIKRQARQQAAKDNYYCPLFMGANNTFEQRLYENEYRKTFKEMVENERN